MKVKVEQSRQKAVVAGVSEVGHAGHPGSGLPQPWPKLS